MYRESRVIHLIEEVLKVDSDTTLSELETVLKKSKKAKPAKWSIYDYVGMISDKEAKKMTMVIQETSEIINEDDWR